MNKHFKKHVPICMAIAMMCSCLSPVGFTVHAENESSTPTESAVQNTTEPEDNAIPYVEDADSSDEETTMEDSYSTQSVRGEPIAEDEKSVGEVKVSQKSEFISSEGQTQDYTFSYKAEDETHYQGGTKFKISFDKSFTLKTIHLGKWSDCPDTMNVEVCEKDKVIKTLSIEKDKDIDVSEYKNADSIKIFNPEIDQQIRNFEELTVSGVVNNVEDKELFYVKGDYEAFESTDSTGIVVAGKKIATYFKYFNPEKPVLSLSTKSLDYQESFDMIVNHLGGSGTIPFTTYEVSIPMPERVYVKEILAPRFDNADVKILIDEKEVSPNEDGNILLKKSISNIKLLITTNETSFTQNRNMVVAMKNNSKEAGSEDFLVTTKTTFGSEHEITKNSDTKTVKFIKKDDGSTGGGDDGDGDDNGGGTDEGNGGSGNIDDGDDGGQIVIIPINPNKPAYVDDTDNDGDSEDSLKLEKKTPITTANRSGLHLGTITVSGTGNSLYNYSKKKTVAKTEAKKKTFTKVEDKVDNASEKKSGELEKIIDKKQNKVSDTVKANRFVQIGLFIGIIIIVGLIITALILQNKKGFKKNSLSEDDDEGEYPGEDGNFDE